MMSNQIDFAAVQEHLRNQQQILNDYTKLFQINDQLQIDDPDSMSPGTPNSEENENEDWQWDERLRLIQQFSEWTSGNENLDKFIQQTQLETPDPRLHMQWIPFENFTNIKFVKRGGFSSVYSATWLNKKEKVWDSQQKAFVEKLSVVALKSLKNSKELSQDFLDEFKRHGSLKLDGCGNILYCHGVTRNPETLEYMIVMNFAEEGDLRHYLERNMTSIRWKDAVDMLCNIAMGLMTVHKNGTFHRNLHSGNVLKFFTCTIADFGLSGPVNRSDNRGVYGTLPFVAPEVLAGEPFTDKADIYSFGYIMWELSSGRPPFAECPHDHTLALEICHGYREAIVPSVPSFYEKLMKRCWDADPKNRPDAEEILDILVSPFSYHRRLMGQDEFNFKSLDDFEDVEKFEKIMNSRIITSNFPQIPEIHPFAFYTSRFLLFPNLPTPHNANYVSKPAFSFFLGVKDIVHIESELTFEEYDTHQPPPELSDTESNHTDETEEEIEEEEPFVPPPPSMMQRRKSMAPQMLMV
ncbi:hypothetical protein G9A89_006794 [Geosiphon pyriformis]|nr:hypothetical protein G9A89_006794 [Geosiphon pyriformis]